MYHRVVRPLQAWRSWPWQHFAIAAVTLGFLAIFGVLRFRYVGGCDSAAYFTEALRLRGLGRAPSFDPLAYPAAVPLCHVAVGPGIVSVFPVGFPVLLALGQTVGAGLWVAPLCGASAVALLYAILVRETDRTLALVLAMTFGLVPETFHWCRDRSHWASAARTAAWRACTWGNSAFSPVVSEASKSSAVVQV